MNNHRVRRRNIQPGFNNRRGKKDVILAIVKGVHPIIQLARCHLAVRNHIGQLRQLILKEILYLRQITDAGHDIKGLPAPIMFAQQRLAQGHRVEFAHVGADGQTVDRRRADDRQIAHPGQRQLQRARDRRCRQGQHMNIRAQRLEPFLVADPKMLFFVDDQKTEVLEADVLGQQRMCADDNIDSAARHAVAGQGSILGRYKAAQLADLYREPAEPLGKALVVLARQEGRGRNHRYLHPRHRRDKGRAHCHLGLAKTHVATDQTVHRVARCDVVYHIRNGAQLIVGLDIGKAR